MGEHSMLRGSSGLGTPLTNIYVRDLSPRARPKTCLSFLLQHSMLRGSSGLGTPLTNIYVRDLSPRARPKTCLSFLLLL